MVIYPEITSSVITHCGDVIVKIESNIKIKDEFFNIRKEYHCKEKNYALMIHNSIIFTKQFYKECELIKSKNEK